MKHDKKSFKLLCYLCVNKLFFVKLLALALTNLVLDLANLVTNLAIPSLGQPIHQPNQI